MDLAVSIMRVSLPIGLGGGLGGVLVIISGKCFLSFSWLLDIRMLFDLTLL